MVCKRQIVRGLPTGKKRFFDLGPPPVALKGERQGLISLIYLNTKILPTLDLMLMLRTT